MGRLGPGRRLLEVLWPLRNYGIGARDEADLDGPGLLLGK